MQDKQMTFDYAREPVMRDTKFMSGEEKKRVLRDWEDFLKSGCNPRRFTKALYKHLINHGSFIAHFDINGFCQGYLVEGEDTVSFLPQFDRPKGCRSIEYGLAGWLTMPDYADINNVMCDVAARYIPQLVIASEAKQQEADVARAKALPAKHGIRLKE